MDINTLTLDQIKALAEKQIAAESAAAGAPLRIVIAQRGFVYVGRVTEEGERVVITNAACVRRWGTTEGLGELAANGPQSATVLDPCPAVRLHALAIVNTIDCAEDEWPGR